MSRYNDYSIAAYGRMINDQRRTGPFVEALRRAITPGDTVLDIGTGTGFLAFMACQFGAVRVYAVEPDRNALHAARACAADVPGSERITWIEGLSTEIDLPEQVDVAVGDLHGTLPFFKGNLESMADAARRHLKPGGRMLPSRDLLHAAPAHAPAEYTEFEQPWRSNDYGLDLSAGIVYVTNQWKRAKPEPVPPDRLLAGPQRWGEVVYATGETRTTDTPIAWTIERAATMHGFYVWFDGDLGDGIGYSNAPTLPELVYGRAFFPLERAIDVQPGDTVQARLSAKPVKGNYVYRWDSVITAADGTRKARFEQSTFKSNPLSMEMLRKSRPEHVPALGLEGRIAHVVLQGMENGHCLQQIADSLAARFPKRFDTPAKALDQASRLSFRFG